MKQKISKKAALTYLNTYTDRMASEKKDTDAEYAHLQLTWNADILERSVGYVPTTASRMVAIGSFYGLLELAMANFFDEVICVDHKSFLPKWKQPNVSFYKANIDSGDWTMPEGSFDMCFFIETVEHLLWSPLPLLNWIRNNCRILVMSTPDDKEWPAMEVHPWTRYQHFSSIPPAAPGVKGNPLPMFHSKQYTQAELIDMLDSVGFRLLEFFRTGEGKHQMVVVAEPRT